MRALILAGLLALTACAHHDGPAPSPTPPPPLPSAALPAATPLLVGPTFGPGPADVTPLRDACLHPDQWSTGWARMTWLNAPAWLWGAWTDDDELRQCLANLAAAGKGIAIEIEVLKPSGVCTSAEQCWAARAPVVARLKALGAGKIAFHMDEPWTGSEGYLSLDQAVQQTAAWIALARAAYPDATMILVEAFPHHSAADLVGYFTRVNALEPIQYAAVDHDGQAGGTVLDLDQIRDGVRSAGIGYEHLYWNADPALTWAQGLAAERARMAGLDPDLAAVSDWTGHPSAILPETDPASFTGSLLTFLGP